jgi:hypothetical protein
MILTLGYILILGSLQYILVEFLNHPEGIAVGEILVLLVLFWTLLFPFISRWLECQADLFAARAIGSFDNMVATLEGLVADESGEMRTMRSWRHFSVAERVNFLRHMQYDPQARAHFGSILRGICFLCATVALMGLTGITVMLLHQHLHLAERRLTADLVVQIDETYREAVHALQVGSDYARRALARPGEEHWQKLAENMLEKSERMLKHVRSRLSGERLSEDPIILALLARLMLMRGKPQRALTYCQQAYRLGPRRPAVRLELEEVAQLALKMQGVSNEKGKAQEGA